MATTNLRAFIRDEQGGYTIWSLIWFMAYVAIGGLAVDVTDAYRNQTSLQATADAAALAAVMSLPDEADAVAQALDYAAGNMDPSFNGAVLLAPEVVVGTWDKDARSFAPGGTDPNAVHVITRRGDQNGNPVGMNFLRILSLIGVPSRWNIATEAIAIKFIPGCVGNGLIALNKVKISGNNSFVNEVCVHGQNGGVTIQNNNVFESGVQVSMGNMEDLKAKVDSNDGLGEALIEGDLWPRDVDRLDEIFEGLIPGEDGIYTEVPDAVYDTDDLGNPIALTYEVIGPDYSGTFLPHHVYYVDCANTSQQLVLPPSDKQPLIEKTVIFAECRIQGSNLGQMEDVVFASTATGNGQNPLDVNAIQLAANADLGTPEGCALGRGIELYSASSAKMSAGGDINGLYAVVAGNFEMTAGGGGISGVDVEAGQDIIVTSNNAFGSCPGNGGRKHVWHYRLVR